VQTYVVVDYLDAADGKPHRFDWLLHTTERMAVDGERRTIMANTRRGQAKVTLLAPDEVEFVQHDRFAKPAIDWRPGAASSSCPSSGTCAPRRRQPPAHGS
jgi:hypothetical protein